MLQKIIMPKLGDTMEEGTIVSWFVQVGESFRKGDIIMQVESDKATLDVESLVEGKLLKIVVGENLKVPIGSVVAWVGSEEDKPPSTDSTPSVEDGAARERKPTGQTNQQEIAVKSARSGGKQRVSPRAQELAQRLGIQVADIGEGTGPGGRITSRDVQEFNDHRASSGQPKEPLKGRTIQLSRLRKLTADRMVQSWNTVPCFTLFIEVRMDRLLNRMENFKVTRGKKIAIHDTLIAAAAEALREYPLLTGRWTEGGIFLPERFGIGLAVALEDGLVAPVVRAGDLESLMEVANRTRDIIARARSDSLNPDDLSGACLTISNLGMMDIEAVTPIVIPGQGSIIGVGKIRETPVVEKGKIATARVMKMTLAVDHRLTDGAYAAGFLNAVRGHLEHPDKMFD